MEQIFKKHSMPLIRSFSFIYAYQWSRYSSQQFAYNYEQIITDYPKDGAMGSSCGGRVRKLSAVCLHNAVVARDILVTKLHCGTPEPSLSAIYIVSSVGTSLFALCLLIVAYQMSKIILSLPRPKSAI